MQSQQRYTTPPVRRMQTALFQKPLNINELQTRAKDWPQDFRKHTISGNRGNPI